MLLLSLILGLVIVAAYAAGFVAATWYFVARFGFRWLPAAWLVGAATLWLVSLLRLRALGTPLHFPPQTTAERLAVFGILGFAVFGAGLATLSVRRRLRRSTDASLTFGSTAAGVGAFFAGMLVALLVVGVIDLWT